MRVKQNMLTFEELCKEGDVRKELVDLVKHGVVHSQLGIVVPDLHSKQITKYNK